MDKKGQITIFIIIGVIILFSLASVYYIQEESAAKGIRVIEEPKIALSISDQLDSMSDSIKKVDIKLDN